jgi:hypothetical protein
MTADFGIHLMLLLGVVGLPWVLLAYGLRADMRSMIAYSEEEPPRRAALMARYRDSF